MKTSFKQSLVMSSGTIVNSLLGLGFYVLLGRGLGTEGFGFFSYLLGLGLLTSEISDLGFNSALVRFGSGDKFPAFFSLVLLVRVVSVAVIAGIFFFLFWFVDPRLIYSAAVAFVGIFSYLVIQSLIARQKYFWQVAIGVLGNAFRLSMVLGLVITGFLTPVSAIVAFSLGGAVTFFAGLTVLLMNFGFKLVTVSKMKETWKETMGYVPSVALSFGLSSFAAKVDMPIVYALAGPVATGIYSSAQKLASVFQQLAAALEGVFAPKFATLIDYKQHFRDYLLVVSFVVLGILTLIPVAPILVPLFFGVGYTQAVTVFQILLIATVLFFASGPFAAMVLYKHGLAKYHLLVTTISFIVSLIAYFVFVPLFGAAGAGLVFISNALVTLLGFVIIWKKLE